MRIYLKEITDQETELDFTQDEAWVSAAVLRVDEHSDSSSDNSTHGKLRPVQVHLGLRQVDEVIVISGKIDTYVELICSRCAQLFQHPFHLKFSALFCQDPVMAGVGHLEATGSHNKGPLKPAGQNQGFARHAHHFASDDQDSLESMDLDITYLSHDYIDLSDVLTEQLQVQIPFQPLCEESCRGVCFQCGTDLNVSQCDCGTQPAKTAFSVLKDLKI